jgi:hypothetical protein
MRERMILTEENNGDPKQVEARKKEVGTTLFDISTTQVKIRSMGHTFKLSNMIGLTSVVIPTPMAQPVMPNPLPCARKSLGNISVGNKNATVPQVAAYLSTISLHF